uniref:dUTPase-like domain-containing protein n=1 Tax=Ditylenchus dipsaci TaxID=166011 RepID=A0A915ETC1_9BILA
MSLSQNEYSTVYSHYNVTLETTLGSILGIELSQPSFCTADRISFGTGPSISLSYGYRARLVPVHNEGAKPTTNEGKTAIGFSVKNFKPESQVTILAGDPIGMLISEKSNE